MMALSYDGLKLCLAQLDIMASSYNGLKGGLKVTSSSSGLKGGLKVTSSSNGLKGGLKGGLLP